MWTFSSSIVHVCEIEDVNECEIVDAIEEGTLWKVFKVSSKGFFIWILRVLILSHPLLYVKI